MYDNNESDSSEAGPNDPFYHYNNAYYSWKYGEYEEAIKSCDIYLKYSPKNAFVLEIKRVVDEISELRKQADNCFAEKNYQGTLTCLGKLLSVVSDSQAELIKSEIADVLVLKVFSQRTIKDAVNCLTDALLFNPAHPTALQRGDTSIIKRDNSNLIPDETETEIERVAAKGAKMPRVCVKADEQEVSDTESQQSPRSSPRK